MEHFTNKIKPDYSLIQSSLLVGKNEDFLKKYADEEGLFLTDDGAALLKKELSIFAAKDGNTQELSEDESVDFYNKLMSDNDKDFEKIKNFEKGKNPVFNWLNKLSKQKKIQTELNKDTGKQYDFTDVGILTDLNKEQIAIAKELIIADKQDFFTPVDIHIIVRELKKENIEKAKEFMVPENSFIEASAIPKLASLDDKTFQRARDLQKIQGRDISLSGDEIYMLAQLDAEEINKIFQKNPNCDITIINSHYIAIKSPFTDKDSSIIFDTETGKAAEMITREISGKILKETIENKVNNIKHTVKIDTETRITIAETIARYDNNGNLLFTENMSRGKDGFTRNVSITYKNGKQIPVQWATNDAESGNIILQRNLISPDGTRTNYYYEESPEGMKINEYKITDKDGNVLLNQRRTFMPVAGNPDKFISSVNDRVYEIEYTGNTVQITDKKENKVTTLDLNKLTDTPNKDIITVLKKLPGDALIDIAERHLKKINIDDMIQSWDPDNRVLYMNSSEYSDETEQMGIFMHEFGHFLDTKIDSEKFGEISQNPEFVKIYNKELENFKKHSTSRMEEYIDYFIDHDGSSVSAQSETVAESHKILTSPHTQTRTYYLQQNFPETIAKIAELINKQENN